MFRNTFTDLKFCLNVFRRISFFEKNQIHYLIDEWKSEKKQFLWKSWSRFCRTVSSTIYDTVYQNSYFSSFSCDSVARDSMLHDQIHDCTHVFQEMLEIIHISTRGLLRYLSSSLSVCINLGLRVTAYCNLSHYSRSLRWSLLEQQFLSRKFNQSRLEHWLHERVRHTRESVRLSMIRVDGSRYPGVASTQWI